MIKLDNWFNQLLLFKHTAVLLDSIRFHLIFHKRTRSTDLALPMGDSKSKFSQRSFKPSNDRAKVVWLVGCLGFTSNRQRGHLEMAPPFNVPCEGREARLIHRTHRQSNPRPSRGSPLHYCCATPAPSGNRTQVLEWLISLL